MKKRIVLFSLLTLLFLLISVPIAIFVLRQQVGTTSPIKHVFFIVMENTDWTGDNQPLEGSPSAPYINNMLLPMAGYANQYYTPPDMHPSLTNYLWLEAGTNFGIHDDNPPAAHRQSTTNHFVSLLSKAGYSWKAYLEDISGTTCPLRGNKFYVPRHNAMVYFEDTTDGHSPTSPICISHNRPFSEFFTDLQNNTVPNYSYIIPNLCHDMHGTGKCKLINNDRIKTADVWLSHLIPQILNSQAYKNDGALFIIWDEGADRANGADNDGPIPFILISPYAKHGYSNNIHYDHSSTLKTLQEIFGITPLLGGAAHSNDLSDLFTVSLTERG